jgi:DNA (cytosine-5)-methyltransferase 1
MAENTKIEWAHHTPPPRANPLTKTAQVRMCGNSVCPPLACALVAANYAEKKELRAAA